MFNTVRTKARWLVTAGTALMTFIPILSLAAIPSAEAKSVAVTYRAADLDTPEGIAALYRHIRGAAAVVCSSFDSPLLDRQIKVQAVLHGRKQFRHLPRLGQFVELGHVQTKAVWKETSGVDQGEGPVAQGFGVHFVAGQPKWLKPKASCSPVDGIFEIAVLRLEMMRAQVHALRPDHSGKKLHKLATSPEYCIISAIRFQRY